ncbi:MAG: CreA family protein [Methyloprofundus sp.]|nr:CreA family protein [Methyloprofundus sp.]
MNLKFLKNLTFLVLTMAALPAWAERIGHVDTNFKWTGPDDKIIIESFDDPEVSGVACFLSRAKTGGFSGAIGVAEDSSDASISCRQIAAITLSEKIKSGKNDGDQVFAKRTSLVFKSMQVVRFYDKTHNTLIYLVYSDRVIEGSPKQSISAVPIMPWK